MNDVDGPLWDENKAAAWLNVAVATLRRWRWAGKPPEFVKIGGSVRYFPQTVKNVAIAGRRSSTSDNGLLQTESPAA